MKPQKDTNAATAANTEGGKKRTKPVTVGLVAVSVQVDPEGKICFQVSTRNKLRGTEVQKSIDDILVSAKRVFRTFLTGDYDLKKRKKGYLT